MKAGILALQGDVGEHRAALAELGASPVEVRSPHDLAGIDVLVIPGGESTTMSLLLSTSGLHEAVAERLSEGMPALGTCAGMILLASDVLDGRPDQRSFGAVDLTVRRNGFGRQVNSFEADVEVSGLPGGPFPAVFIRAPLVERVGAGVEVLARLPDGASGAEGAGRPVLCRQGAVMVAAFHPELAEDLRLHDLFLKGC